LSSSALNDKCENGTRLRQDRTVVGVPTEMDPLWSLENFDLIAIRIGNEGHFPTVGGEFFTPAGWPDFDSGIFDLFAICNNVGDAESGVDEVLGAGGGVVRRVAEFEKHVISGEFEEGEAIALGGGFTLARGVAESLIECDRAVEIADADAGVEEAGHGGHTMEWLAGFAN